MKINSRQSGFTLLEVMVATIIFVLLASMIGQVASSNVGNHIHLENKVIASWIAENETIELRSKRWDQIKNETKEVESSNRKWSVRNSVVEKKDFMGIPGLIIKEVSVAVSLAEDPDSPLQTYQSYMANEDV